MVCSKEARSSTRSTYATERLAFRAKKDPPDHRARQGLKGRKVNRGCRVSRDHKVCKVKQDRQDRRVLREFKVFRERSARRVYKASKGRRASRGYRENKVRQVLTEPMVLPAWLKRLPKVLVPIA